MTIHPIFLGRWEEAVGILSGIEETGGQKIATIGDLPIHVPDEAAIKKLLSNVGKKVSLLRTDRDFRIKISGVYVP